MLIIERKESEKLKMYEILLRRMDLQHEQFESIKTLYRNARKGYLGELRADREWCELNIQRKHYLFHSFEAWNRNGHSHQIDTLFLCSSFILVMETKDIGGRIDFDEERRQMIQTRADETKIVYAHPADQVLRHKAFIQEEMLKIGISIPVIPIMLFTDIKTWIATSESEVDIFRINGLRQKINLLFQKHKEVLDEEQLERIKDHFISSYRAIKLRRQYSDIPLVQGIVCENCRMRMIHERKGFRCPCCNVKKMDGVEEAMQEYRILYKDWITNSEFRDFMGVESIQTANKMLKRLGLRVEGENRNRKYYIPRKD